MRFDGVSTQDEAEQIRRACEELRVDGEITALILCSHRYDRTLPLKIADDHEDLCTYIRRKVAIWEEIFDGPLR